MKKNIFLMLLGIFYCSCLFSQINPRMLNPNYMWTSLFDTFNTLDRSKWKVADNEPFYGGFESQNLGFLLCWEDNTATISVNNGDLLLSGLKYDNYTTTFNWFGKDTTVTTNFIAATMATYDYFHYGIFECCMTCDYKKGTFPAFWLYNDSQCSVSKRTEIDIMEFKYENSSPEINHGFFYYPPNCANHEGHGDEQSDYNSGDHTYKCIYMPDKVEFYIDNILKHSVTKNVDNQGWYPDMQHHIILSHQLWRYNRTAPYFGIDAPQTTKFHWVSARTFFLAPEITVPSLICSSKPAELDVDPAALNFTWSLTPTNLFSGDKTGTGKTATITPATGASGQGKITYIFQMPSGETFAAEKPFWVGKPVITEISGPLNTPNYQWATYYAEPNNYLMAATDYNWILNPLNGNVVYDYGWTADIAFYNSGTYQLLAQAYNTCGWGSYYVAGVEVYDNQGLSISPNPTTGETKLTIESTSLEKSFDANAEWDLEIYDSFQSLKEKKTKLKGNEYKIQTAGWKEGVYFVRIKYKDKILQGKLVVKR